ncbi:hypothetical protein [Komarekiella delphini-convector]|nr:hypothetical protein [Komarekiella delphini-convector]
MAKITNYVSVGVGEASRREASHREAVASLAYGTPKANERP